MPNKSQLELHIVLYRAVGNVGEKLRSLRCFWCLLRGNRDYRRSCLADVVLPQARKFAKAMHAPLIFTSASHSINVQKVSPRPLKREFPLQAVWNDAPMYLILVTRKYNICSFLTSLFLSDVRLGPVSHV